VTGLYVYMKSGSVLYGQFTENNDSPVWGMTLRSAGSMRFRWNEVNENRQAFLSELCGRNRKIAQVELYHSKEVVFVNEASECDGIKADGILTFNRSIIPVVTVADCMPIYMYDPVSGVAGMLHSGWKGTGIVENALSLAAEKCGSRPENFRIVLGPHIHDCCYNVDEQRASYFADNFTPDCIKFISPGQYALSLAAANIAVLKRCGVPDRNICVRPECTCCNDKFGSFRRETAPLASLPPEEKAGKFTVQAAFIKF